MTTYIEALRNVVIDGMHDEIERLNATIEALTAENDRLRACFIEDTVS